MGSSERLALEYFFRALYGRTEQGFVEIRPFRPGGVPEHRRRLFLPVEDNAALARSVLSLGRRLHVYFGVCTRTQKGKDLKRGTSQYLRAFPAMWADLDAKSFGNLKAARRALDRFPISPSILVFTGHGFHAYWLLEESVLIGTTDQVILQCALRALQTQILGGDDVSDLARILRAPWTYNTKDPLRPIKTKVVWLQEVRYRLDEMLDLIPWPDALQPDFSIAGGLSEESYAGLSRVMDSDFIAYCRDHAESLQEPLWYAMITNLIGFRGGRDAIHELSRPHPHYSFAGTERKIAHALRDAPGPHSYHYIASHGFQSTDLEDSGLLSPASRAFRHRNAGQEPARGALRNGDQV